LLSNIYIFLYFVNINSYLYVVRHVCATHHFTLDYGFYTRMCRTHMCFTMQMLTTLNLIALYFNLEKFDMFLGRISNSLLK
jgi:hypothetical protein